MARVSSTAASTLGTGVSQPDIQNINVTLATEETVTIPAGSRRFTIQMRDCAGFEVRYIAADTEFFTVYAGNSYDEVDLAPTTSYTVYITPEKSGVLEVLSWE